MTCNNDVALFFHSIFTLTFSPFSLVCSSLSLFVWVSFGFLMILEIPFLPEETLFWNEIDIKKKCSAKAWQKISSLPSSPYHMEIQYHSIQSFAPDLVGWFRKSVKEDRTGADHFRIVNPIWILATAKTEHEIIRNFIDLLEDPPPLTNDIKEVSRHLSNIRQKNLESGFIFLSAPVPSVSTPSFPPHSSSSSSSFSSSPSSSHPANILTCSADPVYNPPSPPTVSFHSLPRDKEEENVPPSSPLASLLLLESPPHSPLSPLSPPSSSSSSLSPCSSISPPSSSSSSSSLASPSFTSYQLPPPSSLTHRPLTPTQKEEEMEQFTKKIQEEEKEREEIRRENEVMRMEKTEKEME